MARISQRLGERPFNIKDGEKYIVSIHTDKTNYVLAGKLTNKINNKKLPNTLLSKTLNTARVYQNKKIVERYTYNLLMENNYADWSVMQVKDIFEPRYYIKFIKKHIFIDAHIEIALKWYVKGEQVKDTYQTYDEALNVLHKYKMELVEEYYQMITAVRNLALPEIENGTPF